MEQGELVSEEQLLRVASECYLLLERYKLRTNLVGANLEKDLIEGSYSYLEERITARYERLFERLKEGVEKLEVSFRLAQGNALRTLNNIFRNYRRRVGTLANEPLSSLKYSRYERQQKLLLESIIYSERESLQEVSAFKEELERSLALAVRQVDEKYRRNDRIKQNSNTVFQVIDKSECYTYKYYEGFERGMLTTVASLEAHFDKLNAFLSVWENVGSTKAYEARSVREMESDERAHEGERVRRYYEEETEEQLEEAMRNCPQHSPQREEYRKRLNEVRRYNLERQKKLDMVGRMYTKRRNRAGILVSRGKDVSVLEWVINLDNSKVPYNYLDEFKHFRADNDHAQYRPTPYESHRPLKTAEEARQHLQKHRPIPALNYQWWYDRFGKEGVLDLITGESQQLQKRIQFEVVRQTELQNNDDRRKRELLEKQNYQMKENQRREGLHIGYRHVHDKTELEWLVDRTYNTQYIPGIRQEDDITFSDDEQQDASLNSREELAQPPPRTKPKANASAVKEEFPFIKLQDTKIIAQVEQSLPKQQDVAQQQHKLDDAQMPIEQQIIGTYFREYSKKLTRKQQQPEYKKTQFLYFRNAESIEWQELKNHLHCQKIFIYTDRSIFFFTKVISAQQEKMKVVVYTIEGEENNEDEWQASIRTALQKCFHGLYLVTVRFQPIYLDNQDVSSFMMGLLMMLVREGKMFEDLEIKDYVNEGKEIIDDFNQYYYPSDNRSTKSLFMRRFMPQPSQEMFAPKKNQNQKRQEIQSQKSSAPTALPTAFKREAEKAKVEPALTKQGIEAAKNGEKQMENKPKPGMSYASMFEQRELKRSDSREFMGKLQLGQQLRGQEEQEGGENNDYEQL